MKLTVITACLPGRSDYLVEAGASVPRRLNTVNGAWEVEWVLALDGPGPVPAEARRAAATVIQAPQREGVSGARNRALLAAAGTWIVNLDGDDTLIPGGMETVASAIDAAPESGWAAGVLLNADGAAYPPRSSSSNKRWKPGQLVDEWAVPMAFHPGVSWMSRDLLLASGGWPALAFVEDKLPVFSVSELAPGVTVPDATHVYRRHSRQTSATPAHAASRQYALEFTCAVLTARRRLTDATAVVAPHSR